MWAQFLTQGRQRQVEQSTTALLLGLFIGGLIGISFLTFFEESSTIVLSSFIALLVSVIGGHIVWALGADIKASLLFGVCSGCGAIIGVMIGDHFLPILMFNPECGVSCIGFTQ